MRIGIIGFGNIAASLLDLLDRSDLTPAHVAVLASARGADAARAQLAQRGQLRPHTQAVVTTAEALVEETPNLVIECAGHGAVISHVPTILQAGIDVIVVSVGALADAALAETLRHAAQAGGAQVILPAGAVGGIDLLSALSAADGLEVRYRGTKPPRAWAGSRAEDTIDLAATSTATVFFQGSARQAALAFPKNANVAATLALAGAGLDDTLVELIADPAAAGNIHSYEVRSAIANYRMEIESLPSAGNAKTSASTVYSILRAIRNRTNWVTL